ncbi:MAG: hypothetical protein WCL27_07610 [Betaproteobacteria bacterium]
MSDKIRKTITRAELNAWLTQDIRKIEDCIDAKLEVQYLLAEPDENGCNWSGLIATPGKSITAEQIVQIAAMVGHKASTLFNLAEE